MAIDTKKMQDDASNILNLLKKISPGSGVKKIAEMLQGNQAQIIKSIKQILKINPTTAGATQAVEFLVDRYKLPESVAARLVANELTDANIPTDSSGSADEGFPSRPEFESSAEDTSVPPKRKRLSRIDLEEILKRLPKRGEIIDPGFERPRKRFPGEDRFYPEGPGEFPKRGPFRPGDGGDIERGPLRPFPTNKEDSPMFLEGPDVKDSPMFLGEEQKEGLLDLLLRFKNPEVQSIRGLAKGGRAGFAEGTEPTFEDYLKEREMLDKNRNMENLMKEYQDDMNRKKVMEQKQMAGTDTPEIEIEMLQELLQLFREKFNRDPVSIDELKRAIGQMREKSATGGLTRTSYAMGKGPVLPSDEDPINPFQPTPTGPVLPDKSMKAEFSLQDYMDEFERVFPDMIDKRGTQEYMDMLEDYFRGLASKDREGNMKMASAPDIMDDLNQLSLMLYKKPLKDLTDDEYDRLQEYAEEKLANGGRVKFSEGESYEIKFMKLVSELREAGFSQQEAIEEAKKQLDNNMAYGGRVMKQTGGITETRQLPPEFLEAAQKTFLADLTRQAGLPTVTTATTQQPGETAEQFAARQAQAQQFGITKAGMAGVAPQVAAETQLQQDARGLASGLGSFQPFLTKATTAADAMTPLTGTGAGTGAGSIASYQSPYQQQVIDATLTEFDRQAQIRANQNAAATLGVPGAFGGGREGVQLAEYQASSDRNRAAIQAGLLQEGFQNAAARRQQDLANQQAISTQQRGLGAAAQDFTRAQISGLGTLGSAQQAQQQAILDAQRQAAQMAVDDPRRRLGLLGTGITSITPGAGGVTLQPEQMAAQTSPLSQALGFGLMGADIYGRIFRPTGS
jgi:hypothetical protein